MSALASLPLAFSGLALIGLSMDRHARQAGRAIVDRRLRVGGWVLLGLSLMAALASANWRFGLVEWVGVIAAGAGLVVLTLLYRPRWLLRAAIVGVVVGMAGLVAGG